MKLNSSFVAVLSALRRGALLWTLAASGAFLPATSVHGQGYYFPVLSPATPSNGAVYNGQPYIGVPAYALLDNHVRDVAANLPPSQGGPQLMSIWVQPPPGYSAPTNAVFETAVYRSVTAVLSGALPAVTLQDLVSSAVQYLPTDSQNIGLQIAKAIVTTYPGATPADAVSASNALTTVVDSLSTTQPTLVLQTVRGMLSADTNGKSVLGVAALNDPTLPTPTHVIADVVAHSIAGSPNVASNTSTNTLQGVAAILGGNMTAQQKSNAMVDVDPSVGTNGFVQQVMASAGAQNNQQNVSTIVAQILSNNAISIVIPNTTLGGSNPPISSPYSSVGQILEAAVNGLQFYSGSPTATQQSINLYNVIALTDGALTSLQGGANASQIATLLSSSVGAIGAKLGQSYTSTSPAPYSTQYSAYAGAVVAGYTNSASYSSFVTSSTYTSGVAATPNYGAASASGALTKTQGNIGTVIQLTLSSSPSAVTRDIAFASVVAAPNYLTTGLIGAINPSGPGGVPAVYGGGSFKDLAWGAFQAAQLNTVIAGVSTLFTHLGTYAASDAAMQTRVSDSVTGAIDGADAGGKTAEIGDITYQIANTMRSHPGYSGPTASAAMDAANASSLGSANNYIVYVSFLAGDFGSYRTAIIAAASSKVTDTTAGSAGQALVLSLQTDANHRFVNTLTAFKNATTPTSLIANVYAAVLANNGEADAGLAAAIKQAGVDQATVTTLTNSAIAADLTFNANASTVLGEVSKVASLARQNALSVNPQNLFPYVGSEVSANPSMVKDIATAWTVVDPDHAHYVATAVAFNSPSNAYTTVASIFSYAQIVNPAPLAEPTAGSANNLAGVIPTIGTGAGQKNFPGLRGAIMDQPAAAAAITAGYVTGILESDPSFRFGSTNMAAPNNGAGSGTISAATLANLKAVVGAAVASSVAQSGVTLQGPVSPFNAASTDPMHPSTGYANQFRQNTGLDTTHFFTTGGDTRSYGAAGAVTGFVAQLTYYGDSTISPTTIAVLTAAGSNAKAYGLEMAQAAAQAFAWVAAGPGAGSTFNSALLSPTNQVAGNVVYDIASALLAGNVLNANPGSAVTPLQQLMNAAYFGITEANNGTIGAGALGLNATGLTDNTLHVAPAGNAKSDFYQHASATGTPVTNIFNL